MFFGVLNNKNKICRTHFTQQNFPITTLFMSLNPDVFKRRIVFEYGQKTSGSATLVFCANTVMYKLYGSSHTKIVKALI
jgi:hypothetical protein